MNTKEEQQTILFIALLMCELIDFRCHLYLHVNVFLRAVVPLTIIKNICFSNFDDYCIANTDGTSIIVKYTARMTVNALACHYIYSHACSNLYSTKIIYIAICTASYEMLSGSGKYVNQIPSTHYNLPQGMSWYPICTFS